MEAIHPKADLIMQQQDLENEMTFMGIEALRAKVMGAVEKGGLEVYRASGEFGEKTGHGWYDDAENA